MLTYTPGTTLVHRLDPRTKLAFQAGFAIAVFTRPDWAWLAGMTVLAIGIVVLAGLSVWRALRAYWFVFLVLALGPVIAAITLGTPWIQFDRALASLQSVSRVVPILLVSAAYIHATPIRETRAAIQQTVPGKPGQLLGVGVGLTFRFLPVVREDLRRTTEAIAARGGETRSVSDRASRITTLVLSRSLDRADRLSLALRARCFAWNPTLPRLRLRALDYPVLGLSVLLALSPLF